jgi:Cd(II)/Pb(II)-responsive transcriptional regulator
VVLSLKIGDIARRAQCPAQTIRYYERAGLLPEPTRTSGNYRIYGREHVQRLAFIRNCRALDMTLEEIRKLLQVRDLSRKNCESAHQLLDEHISHVATRIGELRQLERQLKALRRECGPERDDAECAILGRLSRRGATGRGQKSTAHVRGAHRV